MFKISVVASNATYSLASSVASVNEGSNVNVTLTTTGVQRGQSVPFTISGPGISLEDFEGLTSLTGSFVVGADGTSTINLSVKADQTTEGPETFTIALLGGQASVNVLLNDTSLMAALLPNTVLLLRANGANDQNNNVFIDSSPNNFTLTRHSNVTQGSFSPFVRPEGQWGVAFDGGSLAVNSPPPALVDWYSGTFTIEAWIYPQTLTGWHYLDGNSLPAAIGNASTTAMTNLWSFGPISNGTVRMYYWNGTQQLGATSTQTVNIGQWNHIAMCKNASNQVQIFVNGVGSGWIAINGTPQSSSGQPLTIGRISNTTPSGMISNVRIVSGAALYTANFTPSTSPLTAVAGTQLLTCQSNRFRDNSTNNFTITPTGTPRVVVDSPFAREYNPATMGGSAYFDGDMDAVFIPGQTQLSFGTGDFMIEAWIYPTSNAKGYHPVIEARASTSSTPWVFGLHTGSGGRYVADFFFGPARLQSTTQININQWTHIAFSRQGTTARIFVNGVLSGTMTSSHSVNAGAATQYVGTLWDGTVGHTQGYMTGIRVVKGAPVYTSTFTPPTAPVASTAQTSLLLNFVNAGIVDSTGRSVLETVGNARISTAVVRPGQTSSMYFDGTGDWITTPNSAHFNLSTTAPFTIEAWIYYTPGQHRGIVGARINGVLHGWCLYVRDTGRLWMGSAIVGQSYADRELNTILIAPNTWTHVALVKDATGYTGYVNGVAGTKLMFANGLDYQPAQPLTVGALASQGEFPFVGYIDDLRIVKGDALYTANFTPPTTV